MRYGAFDKHIKTRRRGALDTAALIKSSKRMPLCYAAIRRLVIAAIVANVKKRGWQSCLIPPLFWFTRPAAETVAAFNTDDHCNQGQRREEQQGDNGIDAEHELKPPLTAVIMLMAAPRCEGENSERHDAPARAWPCSVP